MKILTVFQLRAQVRRLARRARRLFVSVLAIGLVFSLFIAGKNIFLRVVSKEIRKSFEFSSLKFKYLPLSLTVENLRSLGMSPSIRIRRLVVELPYDSLFHYEKALKANVFEPEIRIVSTAQSEKKPGRKWPISLPVTFRNLTVDNGMLLYLDTGGQAEVRGLDLTFETRGADFVFNVDARKVGYTFFPDNYEISGNFKLQASGRGKEVRISLLKLIGERINIQSEGWLHNLLDPEFDLRTRVEVEAKTIQNWLRLPVDLNGLTRGEGILSRKSKMLSYRTELSSDLIVSNGISVGSMSGKLELEFSKKETLELKFVRPGELPKLLALNIGSGRIEGHVENFSLDPLMKQINIPWPVKSSAWGNFVIENDKLEAEAEFRDQALVETGNLFPLRGRVKVNVDFKDDSIDIVSSDLLTSFARLEFRSHWLPDGLIDTEIRGSVNDLKRGREAVAILLKKKLDFPEIRGRGYVRINILGQPDSPEIKFSGAFSPAGFDKFDVSFAEAEGSIARTFSGKFIVDDPDIKGEFRVQSEDEETSVDIFASESDLEKVLAGLDILAPFTGRVSGNFVYRSNNHGQSFEGSFTGSEIDAGGLKMLDASGGLIWKNSTLFFPELNFKSYDGQVSGKAAFGIEDRSYDVSLAGDSLDLALIYPGKEGRISFQAEGRGQFGRDKLPIKFEVKDLVFSPLSKAQARGEIKLDYLSDWLILEADSEILPGENNLKARVEIPLISEKEIKGNIITNLTNLDLIVPWSGARGSMEVNSNLTGKIDSPVVSNSVMFRGAVVPLPGFAHAIEDFSGSLRIDDNRIVIQEFRGKLGGGNLILTGEMNINDQGLVSNIDVRAEGKNMQLSPVERTRALVDGTARLIKDDRQFILDGDLLIKAMSWRRELDEKFYFSSTVETASEKSPSFFDGLVLNLRLYSPGGAVMENSMGRISGRFDLSVTGSYEAPVLLGDIVIEKGSILFQDHQFRILGGRLSFFNPGSLDPYLEVRGETFIKDYRITMKLTGLTSRLHPEFNSSPPLSSEEVLALLALGETFKKTYSTERTTTLSTASLLSYQLADQAKKSSAGLFSLDRLRIDPIVSGASSEMAARLTLGKKLSKNVLLIYSTNLATQRDEIYRLEWGIGMDFSLVAVRNELGRLGLDFKLRKRF